MAEGGRSKPPQDMITEIGVDDLYEFLGVDSTCSEKELTTGYRKKALKYHPDKNPDNPNASDLFQKLSKAYHILTDPAAKAAYDKWLRARHAAKKRHDELNAKRRKLKESLESREGLSYQSSPDEAEAARRMQKEIDRLREEGFRRIREQEELLRQQLRAMQEEDTTAPSLKVTWKAKKGDASNGGYNRELLESMFSKLGVHHVLVSKKRNGKAVISFHSVEDAQKALRSVIGLEENPLHMTWASGDPHQSAAAEQGTVSEVHRDDIDEEEYEKITLMRLKQAQEKKNTEK